MKYWPLFLLVLALVSWNRPLHAQVTAADTLRLQQGTPLVGQVELDLARAFVVIQPHDGEGVSSTFKYPTKVVRKLTRADGSGVFFDNEGFPSIIGPGLTRQVLTHTQGGITLGEQKLKPYQIKYLLDAKPSSLQQYKAGKSFGAVAIVLAVASGLVVASGILASTSPNVTPQGSPLLLGLGGAFASLGVAILGSSKRKRAIETYNQAIRQQQ